MTSEETKREFKPSTGTVYLFGITNPRHYDASCWHLRLQTEFSKRENGKYPASFGAGPAEVVGKLLMRDFYDKRLGINMLVLAESEWIPELTTYLRANNHIGENDNAIPLSTDQRLAFIMGQNLGLAERIQKMESE